MGRWIGLISWMYGIDCICRGIDRLIWWVGGWLDGWGPLDKKKDGLSGWMGSIG